MAAESDFASNLIDSLKFELPWLPPSSWESIPSESGQRFDRPLSSSEHRPRPQPTSVSEESMVRLAMNALQGVESSLISIEKISSTFSSDASDRTFHQIPSMWNRCSSTQALGKLLKSIGRLGFLVFLLRRFVDYFTDSNLDNKILGISKYENLKEFEVQEENYPPHSLVNHAFAVAVGKIIEGYVCALDSLYPSVHLRRSSENVEFTSEVQRIGCLRSVVHSETTLLELYLHTKELRTQIEALGNICNLCTVASRFTEISFEDIIASSVLEFHSFFRGGDLLTYLYTQLRVADPPHRAVLRFLFLHSCEPYCGFITSWIYKADISDPYKEFVVEHNDYSPLSQHGKADMSSNFPMGSIKVRDGIALPCFLSDYVVPLVRAGQQLQVLMKLLECCSFASSEDLTYEDLLPSRNGFLNNHSSNAFPITFDKEEIEAMELRRGCYYEKMHEKLENLFTKLEFRYHQVISHDTTPNGFAYGWKSSSSFKLGNILLTSLAEEKGTGDDTNSENSSMMDDLLESSECSSTNSEEETLSDQLIDLSGHETELEQKYLSALSFSNYPLCSNVQVKPNEYGELPNSESDPDCIFEGRANCHDQQPQSNDRFLRQIFMPIESQETNRSVNDLWEGSTLVNAVYRDNLRSSLGDSHRRERKLGALKEGISFYRKLLVTEENLTEDSYSNKLQENDTDLFTLRDLKVTSDVNFLGLNPMLTRNSFLDLQTDHGEKKGIHGHSLPYFDFSSVNDCKRRYLDFSSVKDCKRSPENNSVRAMDSSAKAPIIKSCPSDKHKHRQDTVIRRTEAPEFNSLQEPKDHKDGDVVPPLISGGSCWESYLAKSANIVINSSGDHRETSPAKFDIPLDFIVDKCLQQEIMLQYKYVSKLTIKLLEEGFDFKQHLLALRRYHFMELADWADLFIISLSTHKWCITEAERRLAEIQGFLESSIQRSSCEFDHNKDRLYVYLKGKDTMPLTASSIGLRSFDFLGLGYRVDWPVSIVLTAGALKIYSEIFSFLIKLKVAIFSLTDVWSSLKELRPLTNRNQRVGQREKEVHHFNLLIKMRHQVNHFVTTLQQYVESQLSHVSWCRFIHSLQHKVKDMMDLESVHMSYLIDSLHICFLSEETQHIAKIIDGVLQCALDFRVCLRGVMRDHDETDRLSRINTSQVFSIKKTFDKNLQELYIYYLKSPKHGTYGLSRFWGYLNYNEHYSDIGNMRRFD